MKPAVLSSPPFSKLVLATHNAGKLREIAEMLAPTGIDVTSVGELGLPEPEETGSTYAANAALKAVAASSASGQWALADDSGLSVEALDGAPGIYSARWAGKTKDFAVAMRRVEDELTQRNAPAPWKAAFVCALCLSGPDGQRHDFEGRIEGTLQFPPRGLRGFGYDPIFVPEGHNQTFAEIDPAQKNAMSHRARAFQKFYQFLTTSNI